MLKQINKHPRDENVMLSLDTHQYKVNGVTRGWKSVSKFVNSFFQPFKGRDVALKMIQRQDFSSNPKYEKYQSFCFNQEGYLLPQRDIIEAIVLNWREQGKRTSELGTQLHNKIEDYYNNRYNDDDSIEYNFFLEFDSFCNFFGLKPFRTEWSVYGDDEMICGTIDMVYLNPESGNYVLVDWKRVKTIDKVGYSKGLEPFNHLQDCNFNKYSLQLNMYKYILEKYYDMTIEAMNLVVLHPDNDCMISYDVPNLSLNSLFDKKM